MRAEKKVIAELEKCYALTTFEYDGERHLVAAAEKDQPCISFSLDGDKRDILWTNPGGVMTMVQYPGRPILLATKQFYSPNNSDEASLIYLTRKDGEWVRTTFCKLPFVHRFGILRSGEQYFLIACTIKSANAFKDDWTCPGRVWTAQLPDNIEEYNEDNPLVMEPAFNGLYKNHGFSVIRDTEDGRYTSAVIGTDNGIFHIIPPKVPGEKWNCEKLMDVAASDMLYMDFDQDGERELLVLSPFHGDNLSVYKKEGEDWKVVYQHEGKLPFLHAIWGDEMQGIPYAFVGNREETKELLAIHYDKAVGCYVEEKIDEGAGPANVMMYHTKERDFLLAANRETNEVAIYSLYL